MGKTAMLLEIADRAAQNGFIPARVTAHNNMCAAIIEQVQLNGSVFFKDEKKHLNGVNAGAFGFTLGLSFTKDTQQQYGFRSKMSLLCDKLAQKKRGVLILIDEVHTSEAMREAASAYQELVGDGKNIAMVMAGLPASISDVLNDKVLTFLNRANKVTLSSISKASIRAYYDFTFYTLKIRCSSDLLDEAAEKTRGFPYLMQLIGYYLTLYSRETGSITANTLDKSYKAAINDLNDNVFKPVLSPLSDNDRLFLKAMADCSLPVSTSMLKEKLGSKANSIQTYRKRLLEAGIIESPRKGELVFAIPMLSEYLKGI